MGRPRAGLLLCLVSAAGFGAMAIFAKDAYDAGAGVVTLLALRFVLAAALLWAIAVVRGRARLSRRALVSALALGGLGYSVQAGAFFGALERMDASLASLLLYAYPALVFTAAVVLGREAFSAGKAAALALASAGVALVLLGGDGGALDPLGVALALGAALAYTGYILVADRAAPGSDPFAFAAAVSTGAAGALVAAAVVSGGLDVGFAAHGWLDLAGIATISTVLAITTFLLGLERVGASTASIVSTAEPVVTVTLAVALLGERLGAGQVAGGVLVLGAVVLLQRGGAGRPRNAVAAASA